MVSKVVLHVLKKKSYTWHLERGVTAPVLEPLTDIPSTRTFQAPSKSSGELNGASNFSWLDL